jgi:hypothetical protein
LKLHLSRLEEMEYLLPHRGRRGQSFVYELLYDGQGQDGKPFVIGLLDVESLRTGSAKTQPDSAHDPNKSGVNGQKSGLEADQSAPDRGQVGPKTGEGRSVESTASSNNGGASGPVEPPKRKNTRPEQGEKSRPS